jgi:hypothetical protein
MNSLGILSLSVKTCWATAAKHQQKLPCFNIK